MSAKKKIFLTGGGGFIGRHIVSQLGASYEICTPRHNELDLTDAQAVESYLKKYPVDIAIHAANVGGTRKTPDLKDAVETNLKMFWNVARMQKRYFDRLIFLGTGAEYDKSGDIQMVTEEDFDTRVPKDSLGLYKYTVSKYIEKTPDCLNLRIFGIYGDGEDSDIRFISRAMLCAMRGEPFKLFQNAKFEYLYIDDFIRILDYFIQNPGKKKFYNVGTGTSVELIQLLKEVEQVVAKKLNYSIEKSGYASEYTCDSSRLRAEIPDLKFTDRTEAIKNLYEYYKTA